MFKAIIIALVVYILIIGFLPFMTIDSGIRCVTTPCPTEVNGGLFEYFKVWKRLGGKPVVFDVEYYVPVFALILVAGATLGYVSKRK